MNQHTSAWLATLAQAPAGDNGVRVLGTPESESVTPGLTGGPDGLGPTPAAPVPLWGNPFFLLILMIVALLLFTSLGGRRERKRRAQMLNALARGDRVRTIAGIIGSIVEIKGDEIVLRVDESSNTRIRFARSAVQEVLRAARDRDGSSTSESNATTSSAPA